MGASREEGLGTWVPTPISWVLLWAGKGSVVLPISREGRVEGPTPDLIWPLGHQLRGWVPASFRRGQETARLSQRRELGPLPSPILSPRLPHFSIPPALLVALSSRRCPHTEAQKAKAYPSEAPGGLL